MPESQPPRFTLEQDGQLLKLSGDWTIEQDCPTFSALREQLSQVQPAAIACDTAALGEWDSALPAFLLQCHNYCSDSGIDFDTSALPEGASSLLKLATAVKPHKPPEEKPLSLAEMLDFRHRLEDAWEVVRDHLEFIGDATIALGKLLAGRANTRREDFLTFIHQSGPDAFGIVTLTAFLVGMILAYLGAAQLAQFGAQIYVADLVTIGMLREMGALMVAVVMAGRTGAAYAAQLGTMQTREEIDAIVTLGISPMEFLVLPRMVALVLIMPLLVLYANVVGIFGGAIVAAGLDVTLTQFSQQMTKVISFAHLGTGLLKSVFFGLLIAIAGCRAGIQCGRSSAAVGEAATKAVVTSIVYLIVADAAFNILFQELGI
ncbi:MAG: ABC transporter permease [Halieaceae bacterium]|nr:ABC transporter permease [Halieaceae bacterium]